MLRKSVGDEGHHLTTDLFLNRNGLAVPVNSMRPEQSAVWALFANGIVMVPAHAECASGNTVKGVQVDCRCDFLDQCCIVIPPIVLGDDWIQAEPYAPTRIDGLPRRTQAV